MNALVNKKYLLEKYPGKGGWTYAQIAEIAKDEKARFGWVKVKGSIDGVPIKQYHLMPMGNGKLFLPVKAAIRKIIKKEAGDYVHVILYKDEDALEIAPEFLECLQDEPKALQFFNSITDSQKKLYTDWMYATKNEDTKIRRMAKAINRLSLHLLFDDKIAE